MAGRQVNWPVSLNDISIMFWSGIIIWAVRVAFYRSSDRLVWRPHHHTQIIIHCVPCAFVAISDLYKAWHEYTRCGYPAEVMWASSTKFPLILTVCVNKIMMWLNTTMFYSCRLLDTYRVVDCILQNQKMDQVADALGCTYQRKLLISALPRLSGKTNLPTYVWACTWPTLSWTYGFELAR